MASFDELVFCGFGEPTERIDVLLKVARYFKETYHKPIRINTNGLGNLVNGRDIAPDFKGLIDTISISLNTPNATVTTNWSVAVSVISLSRQCSTSLRNVHTMYRML